jgi:hypothetical protein
MPNGTPAVGSVTVDCTPLHYVMDLIPITGKRNRGPEIGTRSGSSAINQTVLQAVVQVCNVLEALTPALPAMTLKYAMTSSERRVVTDFFSLDAYGFLRDLSLERSYSAFIVLCPYRRHSRVWLLCVRR